MGLETGDIETLSVKFHFIEESLAEIKSANDRLVQSTQETQDRIKEVVGQSHVDLKAMQDDYIKHRIELSGKETELELKHRKELLESMKRQVLESSGDMGQKEGILKPLNSEIDNLNEKLQTTTNHLAGMKSIIKETSQDLGISGSSIAEIGSIGGLIALAFTAMGESRRYERSIVSSEAQGGTLLKSEELGKLATFTKSLTNIGGLNLSEQEAQSLTSGLLGIRGVNAEDIAGGEKGKEPWGTRVAKMGMSIGEGPTGAVEMVKTMMNHLNVPMQGVESEFEKLRKTSHELGDAHHEYMNSVIETADSLRVYGISLDTTSNVMGMFWDKIQKHEMSMDQVTGLMKLGNTESMGQLAYGGALAAQYGSQGIKTALSGKDALQQADIMQRMLEGSYSENGVSGDQNQKEILEFYGQQAVKAGGAGKDRILEGLMFKTMTGRDILNSMPADQQQGFLERLSAGEPSVADRASMTKMGKPAGIDDIVGQLEKITDPTKDLMKIIKDIAQMIGGIALIAAGWVLHNKTGDAWMREGSEIVHSNSDEFQDLLGLHSKNIGAPSSPGSFSRVANNKELSMLNKEYQEAKKSNMLSEGENGTEEFNIHNHMYLHYPDGHIEKMVTKVLASKSKNANRLGTPQS